MAVTADRLAERTLELCCVPSVIGDEAALCGLFERWAHGHFPEGQVLRVGHSLVLGRVEDGRKPTVVLLGHLDTVPAHPGDAPPRREGDRVYGLGASDMKGALAVMQALCETLPLAQLPVNPVFVLYEREEGPYLENGLGPVLERVPSLARAALGIALEPTDNRVQVGCVGTLHATLTFRGKSAHSARPWQGENAIHKAGELLAELNGLARREVVFGGLAFYEVMSITKASGGRARNVVPEAFELNLNHRFAPGKTLEQAQAGVRDFVRGRAEVTFTDLSPSGRVPAKGGLYGELLRHVGAPPEAKQAWTDVGRLSSAGMDAVNFGPGETAQAHQANESCSAAALLRSYEVLKAFLEGK
jgi:succinyl-diaminopimelate desuccinylase